MSARVGSTCWQNITSAKTWRQECRCQQLPRCALFEHLALGCWAKTYVACRIEHACHGLMHVRCASYAYLPQGCYSGKVSQQIRPSHQGTCSSTAVQGSPRASAGTHVVPGPPSSASQVSVCAYCNAPDTHAAPSCLLAHQLIREARGDYSDVQCL